MAKKAMVNAEEKIAEIQEVVEKLSGQVEDFVDALDQLDETIGGAYTFFPDEPELTKKQRAKRYEEVLKAKYPNIWKILSDLQETIAAISWKAEQVSADAEEAMEKISDAESTLSEARELLDDKDW